MRQMNINKGNYEVKSHYKMYKAGKRWVVAGMATVSLLGGLLMLSTDASADNVDAVVPASESSVTTQVSTPTDSVVLDHASASVAPASSVSAEVSASSASSVAPVSVSTAASVVSAEASLSASQSLASSFVVPADAKKVQDDVDSDGNRRLGFVLAESADAEQDATTDTQAPDSAVTPVQTNAAYTSSTEAKSASLPAVSTSGTIAASSYIKTDSAQNHTSFSYSGSSQISDYFNRTGDIVNLSGKAAVDDSEIAYSLMGAPQATVDEYLASQSLSYYTSNYNSIYSAYLKYGSSTALNYASTYGTQYASASMSNSKASLTSIYNSNHATNIPSSFSNAIKTANEVAQSTLPPAGLKQDEINWKALVPEFKNEGGTLSYNSQLDVSKGFVLKGGYRLVSINQSTKEINISSTVKGAQAVGVVMAPVQPTVMGTTSIAGSNSLNNNDAIATIKKAVIAGRDMYVNNVGDVNSMLVHIRQTDDAGNLYGSGNGVGVSGESSSGYGWATTANGNVISNATNTAGATEVGTDGVQLTTKKGAAQGDMYNGVYFSYTWANPTLNTNGTVTATLTYTEYSDASMHTIIGSVSNILTVDRYMAVGLYAANGGNGNSFFGGISYFEGTNATTDVKVSYTFGEDGGKLLDDTTINAVVGEVIQVIDEKNDSHTDSGMNVSLVAPKIAGLKIDPTSTKTATAGSENIVIKYMVSQKDFTDQVEIAKASLKKIDESIAVLQKMIDVNPSTIDVQSVLTKTQDIRKQASDKIDTLQAAAIDSVTLKTVVDIQEAFKNIMQGANDVAALATDASNQIELAAVITNNSASIKKNISDDDDVTVAKSKINNDIATGQSAEDIAKDKADLEGKISVATQNRNNAIVDADKAIADNTVHNTLVDGAKSALQVLTGESTPTDDTHTKTEIKAGIDNLTKVSSVDVPVNVMDSQDVKDAIANVTDLLIKKPTDTSAIDAALQTLKDKINQAKLAVVEAVKDAQVVAEKALPTNVADQNTTDSDYAKDMKALQDKLSDKDAQLKDIQAAQDAVTGDLAAMQKNVSDAKTAAQTVADKVLPTNVADQNTTDSDYAKDLKALQGKLSDENAQLKDIKAAQDAVTDDLAAMQKKVDEAKVAAKSDLDGWNDSLYKDQTSDVKVIEDDISKLKDLTNESNNTATKSEIKIAQKKLQDDIAIVTGVRNDAVKNGNTTVAANKDNGDPEVKLTVGKLNIALQEGTASDIKKAIDNVKTAVDTVVVPNISDSKEVADAKTAVNDALNAPQVNMSEVQKAVESFNKAVATAQATLKQAVTDANAVKVPANLQDQVEMAKKNKLGDVNQQVTDLHKAAGQDDTTASTLRSAMTDIQGSLDDMTTKLHTTRDAAQKLVEQTADATDTNVVAALKQVTNLLTNKDTTTMTDLQNAMNVLTATSKPATANTVETSSATVESDQVSTPVANGDAAFAIVTDANGKQTVVQLDKTENGTATANVPGAKDAQVVTVPKNGNKPFIFVTDGSGTTQYTELTPNGAKTTITPDGSTTKVVDGVDVPAGANVDVIYLPTAEVSVQAGAKNVQVPGKTGYTSTVTDAQGNEVTLTDGMIAVDGVPAGTNYLVTYTPDPAKAVVKLGTDSGFAKGEEPAAGNTNAQTLMTVQDALNKLQKDDATLAAIVSTGYTDTKVNVTNAVEALNRVDQNLNIDGYAHRIQAPDGTQYNSLEDAVKANPTFAAGTTQMKVVYAPLDGQKIQVKDADGNILGTVMGKSDAEINVDDFKSVDADLQAKAEKGKLKMTVTAPDGKTYDSLMDALQATGYFDHVGLEDGPSSFDQSDAKFVATAWDETGKATAGYMVLGEPATPNDLNIQDFVVSFAPANDGAGHNNTNAGSKTGSSVAANNQNGDQVNVAGPANGSHDGSEVNNATVAGQASGAQVTGSQTDATANTAQNAGWQAQGATQNSDNTASLLAAAGNEQQAKTANSDDARITEMPDSAAVIQDSILPLESAKQAMNLTGRVTEDNFLVVVAAMVASGLFGLLLAFWRRRKEDDQATR